MPDTLIGEALALVSAFFFACAGVAVAKGSTGGGGDRGAVLSVVISIGVSAVLWITLEGGGIGGATGPEWWTGVAWFALAGLFAMNFGRGFLYVSIRRLGVTRASAVKRLNPFFSVILAFLLLGEAVTATDVSGMALIAFGFAILVRQSFLASRVTPADGVAPSPVDYLFGVASALSYASAYVTRKYGLAFIPNPAFGTMVSAVAGLASFAVAAIFAARYRDSFRHMFRRTNRWLVAAGFLISFGQISLFAALFYEDISTVVMIASLEIFIASFLSVVVFRAEARPGTATVIAAFLATAGVIAVAAG